MHLETLKVFCDVVETRSFSTAASQNFVTQSAVSQQVRMLEERYGRRLLERSRGNVQVTPAGEILYQASKDIVQQYQAMEARLAAAAEVVNGTVRVATVHSIGLYELSGPLKNYLTEYPADPGFAGRRPALLLHKYLVNVRHFGDRVLPRLAAMLDGYGW